MKRQLKADFFLLTVALAWGSTFVLTKGALHHISTYNFLSIRFVLSAIVLIILFHKRLMKITRKTLFSGLIIGFLLFLGMAFQTVGLNYTTASKSAFITGFNVVIVPVLSALILRKKPALMSLIGVALSIIGLGLLSLNTGLVPNIGDLYTLFCSFAFALEIILIDRFTEECDPICLASVQVIFVGILSTIFSLLLEDPIIPSDKSVWTAILVTSLFATIYALAIQNIMQQYTTPTHVALIFMGEPVFSALFAYLMLGEILSVKQTAGCILMLAGMVLSELNPGKNKNTVKQTV